MSIRWVISLVIPLFFSSCSKAPPLETSKPIALVSVEPYGGFIEKIAGDTLAVEVLIPPGINLHIYEPTPKSVEKSSKAIVWFQIEEPFERRVEKALLKRSPNQKIVNLQTEMPLRKSDPIELDPCLGEEHHHHMHDRDPHTWMSPKLALLQVIKIGETLIELFPEHRSLYQENLNVLISSLQKLDGELTSLLIPFKGDAILTSHPALGYFCQDYALLQLSVECEGKDPRPRDIEQILKKADKYCTRSVFLQKGFNNRGAKIIGEKLGLPIHTIDPFAKDYSKNLLAIARYISQ